MSDQDMDITLQELLRKAREKLSPEKLKALGIVVEKPKAEKSKKVKKEGTWSDPGICKEHMEVRKIVKCRHCGSEHEKVCTLTKAECAPVIKKSGDVAWVTYDADSKHGITCVSYVSWCVECVSLVESWTHEELIVKYLQLLQEKPKRDARAFVVRPGRR